MVELRAGIRKLNNKTAIQNHQADVFASLGTFAHNMREFDVDKMDVIAFVTKLGELNELPMEMVEEILKMDSLRAKPRGSEHYRR